MKRIASIKDVITGELEIYLISLRTEFEEQQTYEIKPGQIRHRIRRDRRG